MRPEELRQWVACVAQRGLGTRARYRGVVDHDQLADVVAGYDALVLPSYSESFGLATAEAMHLGVPVIATRVGFLWDAPASCFVPLGGPTKTAIASVLQRYANDKDGLARFGETGRQLATARFTASRVMSRWRDVYCGLL